MSLENSADQSVDSASAGNPVVPATNGIEANGIDTAGLDTNGTATNGNGSQNNGNHLWSGPPSEVEPAETNGIVVSGTAIEVPPSDAGPDAGLGTPSVEHPPAHDPAARSTLAEWVITVLLLLFLTTTLVQAFVIPTGSMEDTLLIGDHLLVDKMAYSPSGPVSKWILPYREPKRGDIIVFRYPTDIQQTFVKRCMGVPGDHIRIVNKQVYINGRALDEPYKVHKTDYIEDYRDNFPSEPNVTLEAGGYKMLQNSLVNGEIVVPPGSYFAMGDNRDYSWDSRFWGFVPRQNIIGKPLIIYWSFDRPSDQLTSNSINFPQLLDLATHFFSKTRWRRSFQLIHGYPIQ